MGYTELPDGTRVYSNGFKYKPVPLEQRKYRKFPAGTQWFGGKPFLPIKVLADDLRGSIPDTIADEDAAQHTLGCGCRYCQIERVRRLKRRRLGVKINRDQRPIPE